MFETGMSSRELFNEYNLDSEDIQAQTSEVERSEYLSALLAGHSHEKTTEFTTTIDTARGNRYLAIVCCKRIALKPVPEWEVRTLHVGLMETPKGVNALMFFPVSKKAVRFTSHFFSRYRKRFITTQESSRELTNDIVETIALYVFRNQRMTWIETDSVYGDKTHIFTPVNDGVALLEWDSSKEILQANTFLTNEMLSQSQREKVGYTRKYLSMTPKQRKKYGTPKFALN